MKLCAFAAAALWITACQGTVASEGSDTYETGEATLTSCAGGSGGTGGSAGGGSTAGVGGSGSASGSSGVGGAAGMGGAAGGSSSALSTGWTVFAPVAGARTVYVSNNGNDAWPGTSTQPKATIQAGYNLLRDGQADWLLLERGSRWNMSNLGFAKSGPLADNAGWMRLGAYGDQARPRPVINSGSSSGVQITPGYRGTRPIAHVAISDIHIVAEGRLNARTTSSEATGLHAIAVEYAGTGSPFQHLVIENVKIEGYSMGLVSSRDITDLKVRRCIFTEIFLAGGSGVNSSAFITAANGVLLEDNVFYRVQYPDMPGVGSISHFAHSSYIGAEARNVISRGNIVIKATEGFMQRAGGAYERNVSLFNDVAANLGMSWGVTPTVGGVSSSVQDNLFLNANGSLTLGNTNSGVMRNNLLLRGPERSTTFGVSLQGRIEANMGVHNMRFESNHISGNFTYGGASASDTNSFSGLTFAANTTGLGPIATSFASFMSAVGWSGDVDTYGRLLIARDRNNYDSRLRAETLINHYRRAYGMPTLP